MQRAIPACPSLATKHGTPPVMRHTIAMHLLQAGVDKATMALWLGHECVETTHMDRQADLAMTEQALEKLNPLEGGWQRFHDEAEGGPVAGEGERCKKSPKPVLGQILG